MDCPENSTLHGNANDCNLTKHSPVSISCKGADWVQVQQYEKDLPQVSSISFLDGTFHEDELKKSTFENMKLSLEATKFLDLRRNGLKKIENDAFNRFVNLETLNLEDNPITSLSLETLCPFHSSLKVLILQNVSSTVGKLSSVFGVHTEFKKLSCKFNSLKHLDLAFNQIDSINSTFLNHLVNSDVFEKLTLDNNIINKNKFQNFIRDSLNSYRKKTLTIEARNNLVTSISNELVKKLSHSGRPSKQIKMYVKGNPFVCNCTLKYFSSFLKTANGKFVIDDWNKLACSYETSKFGESQLLF